MDGSTILETIAANTGAGLFAADVFVGLGTGEPDHDEKDHDEKDHDENQQ